MNKEKDLTEKTLEAYSDVFADIVNGLLFHGDQVISEDGAAYRAQLDVNERYPVVTLVLYFGDDRWGRIGRSMM